MSVDKSEKNFVHPIESDKIKAVVIPPEKINELIARDTAKKPTKDSLSERGCPACGAYISWDALNDPISYVPAFCKDCGQRFDWSGEEKWKAENM